MKSFKEMIKVDIKVGDTVLGGRFKNKKIVVKSIGKNAKGDLTINGRPLMRYRIIPQDAKEDKEIKEAPLVADDAMIVKSILKKIEDDILKQLKRNRREKVWPMLQTLAKLAGYGVTKTAQTTGKTYRFDLKK